MTKLITKSLLFNQRNLIFLISILGFSFHLTYIFKQTCLSDLQVLNDHQFKFSNPNQNIPDIVICLEHNTTFKRNEVITGYLLSNKTSWLNESYLFEEIIYYDSKMVKKTWKPIDNFHLDHLDYNLNNTLKIRIFFLDNLKCFELNYNMNTKHPKNYVINTILKINFNPNIEHKNYILVAKEKGNFDFSTFYSIDFKSNTKAYYTYFKSSYYDQYQRLINPKLWFADGYKIKDVSGYAKG